MASSEEAALIYFDLWQFEYFKCSFLVINVSTPFTFHFSSLKLSNAFFSINDREMKSESGFSFAMASKPFVQKIVNYCLCKVKIWPPTLQSLRFCLTFFTSDATKLLDCH